MEYSGLRWFKCDFHVHTMSSPCYINKSDTVESWLDTAAKNHLQCIAVTDHNDYRMIDEVSEKARCKGITVFPGVEITCDTSKIHLLVLFDTNKTSDDVREFLVEIGIKREQAISGEGSNKSIFDVCKTAKKNGCIVIPAHIDEFSGIGSMSDKNMRELLDHEYIDAVQVVNQDVWENIADNDEIKARLQSKYGKEIGEESINRWRKAFQYAKEKDIPMISSSDNPAGEDDKNHHGLWGIGKNYTWVKMGQVPHLESLRQSFLNFEERIRTDYQSQRCPEVNPELWIKSVLIEKCSVNPRKVLHVEFNPQLNCIFGGRGSGKSSIIRCIAGALRSGDFEGLADIKADQENFYKLTDKDKKGILSKDSKIVIEIVKNGSLFRITESAFEKRSQSKRFIEKYSAENDEWTIIHEQEYFDLFGMDIYTQKQIYELAQKPDSLSQLIDRNNDNLKPLVNLCDQCQADLTNAIKEVREAEKAIETKTKLVVELKDVEEQIEEYKKSGITVAIENKQKFESEQKAVYEYIETVSEIEKRYEQFSLSCSLPDPSTKIPQEVRSLLMEIKAQVETACAIMRQQSLSIGQKREEIQLKLDTTTWRNEFSKANLSYEQAKTVLEQNGLQAERLDDLLEKQKKKQNELGEIDRIEKTLPKLRKIMEEMEAKYLDALANKRECREVYLKQLLAGSQNVLMKYDAFQNSNSVKAMLISYLGEPSLVMIEDYDRIAEIAIQNGGISSFRRLILDIVEGKQVRDVSVYFCKRVREISDSMINSMMSFFPEDELKVSYIDSNGKEIPLSTASPGQKTTAVLAFVLLHGETPILLDQPEDDLDNRLVYNLVVKQLKNSKKQRQIIVVTHNANIPVNGDAECLIAMDSASSRVRVKEIGTLDDKSIRDEVCNVMEGTEYAFEMRAKKYHLKIIE